ncbi:MAG TPA: glycosyltransferase [Methylomirabilota bacterium]|jgi:glycosyltransferase involved in cell wall biosynthesis|nr:glycosyltransferase [Methylomirabilota bacterium]
MMTRNIDKLTIVLPFFGDGGMERAMINLCEGFLARQISVDLVLLRKGYGTLASEIPSGVKVIEFGAKNYYQAFFKYYNYLKNSKADGIISLATPTNLICIAGKLSSREKIKLLVSTQVTVTSDGPKGLIKRILRKFIYRLYNFADVAHAASLGVAEDLVSFGVNKGKIKVIYNPVVSPKILEMSQQEPPHEWFRQKEVPIVLGIGRLVAQKDFFTLLRAFALARKEKNMRLAILGEGPDREALIRLSQELGITSDFVLLGFSNNPYSYLKRASLFILSSAWEGFGNVLAEAIALGTPAVSTDCPHGPREILENGKYGKLVGVGDFINLSTAILETLVQPPSSDFLQKGAERFTIEKVTEEYLNVFTEKINGK